jgi:hypothetical protein
VITLMISVWVGMCSICCVSGLRIGGPAAVIRIPLTGFDRLDNAAWCTLRILPGRFSRFLFRVFD